MHFKKHLLVFSGILSPVAFWTTLFLCALRFDNYSHLSNLVSELGAAGSVTRGLFAFGLLLTSVLSLIFVIGLIRECKKMRISTIPVLIILVFTISAAGGAIFPMPYRLHGIFGTSSIGLLLSPVLAGILWRNVNSLKGLMVFSILSLLVMLLGFFIFSPDVLPEYIGLKQRFFHIGWSIWFIYLSLTNLA